MTGVDDALSAINSGLAQPQPAPAPVAPSTPSGIDRSLSILQGNPPPPSLSAPAQQAGSTPQATAPLSIGDRIIKGMADPMLGMVQLGAHLGQTPIDTELGMSPEGVGIADQITPTDINKSIAQQETEYQDQRKAQGSTGVDWPRIAGNIVSPVNLAALAVPMGGAGIASKLAMGTALGAGQAGMQPVTEGGDDYWSRKALQLEVGAGVGAAGAGIAAGVFPQMSEDAARLAQSGVPLTPGQMAPMLRRPEEALKSFPILGNFIRSAEGRGTEGFNRAIVNQALEPVGESLPQNISIGRDAISYAQNTLSNKYDDLLPQLTFQTTPSFTQGMAEIGRNVSEMPPEQATQFNNVIQNRLLSRLDQDGGMDGNTAKQVDSELGNFARKYRSSSDAAQRDVGSAVAQVQSLIRDSLAESNPEAATDLKNLNASYAMLTRLENASTRRVGSDGVITPNDLLSAVRQGDNTVRHRSFAAGDALMQEYAEAANRVLPSRMPDSGTTERGFWGILAGDLLGEAALHGASGAMPAVLKYGGLGLAMGLPYTRLGAPAAGLVPSIARPALRALPAPAGGIVGGQYP